MTIKALVLDLDGTLYDTSRTDIIDQVCMARAHIYLQKMGLISKVPERTMIKVDEGMLKGKVSSNVRRLSKILKIHYHVFNTYVNNNHPEDFGIVHDPKLVKLLTEVSKRYKLFIFTNSPIIWARRVISNVGLAETVPYSQIICPEKMGKSMKPDREAYRILLRITGMKKKDILFLDDTKDNVIAARKFGIRSIRVHNTNRNKSNSVYSILEQILKDKK